MPQSCGDFRHGFYSGYRRAARRGALLQEIKGERCRGADHRPLPLGGIQAHSAHERTTDFSDFRAAISFSSGHPPIRRNACGFHQVQDSDFTKSRTACQSPCRSQAWPRSRSRHGPVHGQAVRSAVPLSTRRTGGPAGRCPFYLIGHDPKSVRID